MIKFYIRPLFIYKAINPYENNGVSILENGRRNIKNCWRILIMQPIAISYKVLHFVRDGTGMEIAKALVEKKASEGVLVRFIYDDFGSNNISDIRSSRKWKCWGDSL
ncbi:MAG: hypothetical protein IPN87_17100 [Saprospiraceae bacterium]|nr:hypothetical protein [Candidatus Brachybacter algidus]